MLLPVGGVEEEGSLELLSASRGGQEAPCHPSVGSPLILIFDPGGLKGGTSRLSHCGSWGASEHSQHWLPECQKLLPAPEEPKLAVELDCLRPAAAGAPPASMRWTPSCMRTRAQMKMETLHPSISSLQGFPSWQGRLQHPCWAVYTQDWGQVCTKGRELGDFF